MVEPSKELEEVFSTAAETARKLNVLIPSSSGQCF